ncbi:MAG: PHP domain-containing protein [Chloroflexi bacterium]|nr:PHP domain-containing protein [Chloroflexota bacterium]
MRKKLRIEGVAAPEQARGEYVYIPFEVPPGARRIEVNYHYENQVVGAQEFNPGNNIDIGVFDVRGHDFLHGGFRGWSGGARSAFYISPDAATPGYLRGPLQPGEWTIMFGLSKIEEPSRYRVNIEMDIDPSADTAAEPGEVPVPGGNVLREAVAGGSNGNGGGRWYRGDLHAHSEHSDGANTVEEIVGYVHRAGLDYFALTDHNTISHWDELARLQQRGGPTLLIAGEEITMYTGHANVWGLDGWIDFRGTDAERVQRLIEHANQRGSMFSINHPDSPIPWKHNSVHGYQAVEVWNAPWRYYNEPALIRWQYQLNSGKRMVAVGGSDSHCVPPAPMTQPNGPGEPCTWVWVEGPLTQKAVLDAVAAGRVFISEAPNGPMLDLRADADGDGVFELLPGDVFQPERGQKVRFHVKYRGPDGKHLRFFNRRGLERDIIAESEDFDDEFEMRCDGDEYLRVECRGFRGRPDRGEVVHALTNPIYWGRW